MISKEFLHHIWQVGFEISVSIIFIFCVVALIRRYWLCYWAYVDDGDINELPGDLQALFGNLECMWNNNSPWSFTHIFFMFIVGMILMIFWPLVLPYGIFAIIAETHRSNRRKRKKFEAELKGNKTTT